MNIAIRVPAFLVRSALWIQQFTGGYLVMCRGYNEDDANFTELVWEDDKDLDFFDKGNYPAFQIWVKDPIYRLLGRH